MLAATVSWTLVTGENGVVIVGRSSARTYHGGEAVFGLIHFLLVSRNRDLLTVSGTSRPATGVARRGGQRQTPTQWFGFHGSAVLPTRVAAVLPGPRSPSRSASGHRWPAPESVAPNWCDTLTVKRIVGSGTARIVLRRRGHSAIPGAPKTPCRPAVTWATLAGGSPVAQSSIAWFTRREYSEERTRPAAMGLVCLHKNGIAGNSGRVRTCQNQSSLKLQVVVCVRGVRAAHRRHAAVRRRRGRRCATDR